jgi:hypothetical protein
MALCGGLYIQSGRVKFPVWSGQPAYHDEPAFGTSGDVCGYAGCWPERSGKLHSAPALLEDTSSSGACLQLDNPIPLGTEIRWMSPAWNSRAAYCLYQRFGVLRNPTAGKPACRFTASSGLRFR